MTAVPKVEFDLFIARKETAAEGVARLTLMRPDGAELPSWEPGAHIDLHLRTGTDDLVRQYSLCGSPADRFRWQVAVLREPDGRGGSACVHDTLAEGDVVRAAGPRNNFELVDAKRYLFIAGGIGITPIIPMAATAEASGADWRLLYGGRSRRSMGFTADLVALGGDRVQLKPQDEYGPLALAAVLAEPDPDTAVYCCGPEPLLRAVETQCSSWPAGALHVERFAPTEGVLDGPRGAFGVHFARSGITITVPADRSILEVAEEAGIDIDSSCQEGTCGTCETTVLEGIPDHRDSILADDEREAHETIMVCVSRACSSRLVLDA